jgi:predicted nucleic acid-binding protein
MKRRVVFNTIALVSAVLSPNGKPFQCTALAKREIIAPVTSVEVPHNKIGTELTD